MYNVLIVDDELIVRHVVQTLIRWEDSRLHYVGSCSNGRSALEMLSSTDVDIVITDIKMPELDGIQLIKHLRTGGYEGEILVLSNYNDFELVRDALKQGAHDYVLKLTMNADSFMDVLGEMVAKLDQRPQRAQRLSSSISDNGAEQQEQAFRRLLDSIGCPPYTSDVTGQPVPSLLKRNTANTRLAEDATAIQAAEGNGEDHRQAHLQYGSASDLLADAVRDPKLEQYCRQLWPDQPDTRLATLLIRLLDSPGGGEASAMVQPLTRLLQELFVGEQVLLGSLTEHSLLAVITTGQENGGILRQLLERLVNLAGMYYNIRLNIRYATSTANPVSIATQMQRCWRMQLAAERGVLSDHNVAEAMEWQPEPRNVHEPDNINSRSAQEEWPNTSADSQKLPNTADTVDAAKPNHSIHPAKQVAKINEPHVQKETGVIDTTHTPNLSNPANRLPAIQWRSEVRQVVSYLQQHYAERIHLPEIAASVHLSEAYLCSIFKAETGKSILTCLNDIRMDRACELLSSGNMLVKEAAAEVGIHDPFYFNRLFKKRYGLSPKKVKTGTILPPLT